MKLSIDKLLDLLPNFRLDARKKNLIGPCPQCGYSEFGVSIEEEHRFGCYRLSKCGYSGNIYTLLKAIGKYDEVKREQISHLPELIEELEQYQDTVVIEEVAECKLPLGWKRVMDNDYLRARGFKDEDFDRYSVGVTKLSARFKGYVIFEVVNYGKCVGYVGRSVRSKVEIERINQRNKEQDNGKLHLRYINSLSDFERIVYGLDEITNKTTTIILVEGILDKINIDNLLELYDDESVKCVATFKANLSDNQYRMISAKCSKDVMWLIMYDGDIPRKIKDTIKYLQGQNVKNIQIAIDEEKDPGDMSIGDLTRALEQAYEPSQFCSFFLEVSKLE